MKTDVENLSTTRVKIVVEIPFDELGDDLREAYRTIGAQAAVPGFRKGKVPPRIIDQRFGRGTVLSEVANAVIPRTYDQVVADQKLVPIGQPKVEVTKLEDGELIEFVAEVDVRPDFELPDPATVSVVVDAVTVGEEAVAEELLNLRKRFGSLTDVNRGAAEGDVIQVDVSATDSDGEPVESFSAEDLTYELGSGGAIEGFDEAVAGAEPDEVRTFEHIPAEGELAGKALTVTVAVKQVRERELPEADDEFAEMASQFDTIAELQEDLKERLGRAALFEQGSKARNLVRDAYLGLVEFDLPEQFISDQLEEHFADGHGDEAHRAEHEAELRTNFKANLVLDKLAEEREIAVDQSELSQWLIIQASRYGMSPDQFANALVEAGQVQSAVAEVRRAKALSLVVDAATITDTNGERVDLDELIKSLTESMAAEMGLDEDHEDYEDEEAEADGDDLAEAQAVLNESINELKSTIADLAATQDASVEAEVDGADEQAPQTS